MAKQKTVPAIDLLIPSATIIKDNVLVFFILLVVPLLLSNVTGPAPVLSETPTLAELAEALRARITPAAVIGSMLTLLFYPLLTYVQWYAAKHGTVSLRQAAQRGAAHYWRLLWLLILMSMIIGIGLAAFIIPGTIFLRMFILSPFYLIQHNLSITDALRQSARESKSYKWPIYSVLAVIALFSITTSFGVLGQIAGTILTVLYNLALALRFHEIHKSSQTKAR